MEVAVELEGAGVDDGAGEDAGGVDAVEVGVPGEAVVGAGVAGVDMDSVGDSELSSVALFEHPANSRAAIEMLPMAANFLDLVDMRSLQGQFAVLVIR